MLNSWKAVERAMQAERWLNETLHFLPQNPSYNLP